MPSNLQALLTEVRACTLCAPHLPMGPRPVLQMHRSARILIAGQAPGRRVHESGVPFDDASGDRLREWLGMPREVFYDARRVAIIPMAFCYPGKGASGDLPPRPECAQTWHGNLLSHLKHLRLTLAIGQYAVGYHVHAAREHAGKPLTETVRAWRDQAPMLVPLPHPSPRNNLWLRRNPWFEQELLPELRELVRTALED